MSTIGDIHIPNIAVSLKDLASGTVANLSGTQGATYHAKVVDVHNGMAVLNVDGKTVMANSDTPLQVGAEYDLVVKGFDSNGRITLQVSESSPNRNIATTLRTITDGELLARLDEMDIPETTYSKETATALLNKGITLNRENFDRIIFALPAEATTDDIETAASILKSGVIPDKAAVVAMRDASVAEQQLPKILLQAIKTTQNAIDTAPAPPPGQSQRESEISSALKAATLPPPGETPATTITPSQITIPDASSRASVIASLPRLISAFTTSPEALIDEFVSLDLKTDMPLATKAVVSALLTNAANLIDPPETTLQPTPAPDPQTALALVSKASSLIENSPASSQAASINNIAADVIKLATGLPSPPGNDSAAVASRLRSLATAITLTTSQSSPPTTPVAPAPDGDIVRLFVSALNDAAVIARQTPQTTSPAAQPQTPPPTTQSSQPPQQPAPQPPTTATTPAILRSFATLAAFEIDSQTHPNLATFMATAKEFIATVAGEPPAAPLAAQQSATSSSPTQLPATAEHAATPAPTAPPAEKLLAQAADIARSPEFAKELLTINTRAGQTASDSINIVKSFATPVQTATDQSYSVATYMKAAEAANSIRCNGGWQGGGAGDGIYACFPFQIGDKTHIGQLRVYRNDDPDNRSNSRKQLDPYDARVVLILDTEYLGLTGITFNTFRDKSIKCDIEVTDSQRKRVVEKNLASLTAGLSENTSYEKNMVTVKVRKRISAKTREVQPERTDGIKTVDIRI